MRQRRLFAWKKKKDFGKIPHKPTVICIRSEIMHMSWEYNGFVGQRGMLCNTAADYCGFDNSDPQGTCLKFNLAPDAQTQCSDLFMFHQQLQQQAKEYYISC